MAPNRPKIRPGAERMPARDDGGLEAELWQDTGPPLCVFKGGAVPVTGVTTKIISLPVCAGLY